MAKKYYADVRWVPEDVTAIGGLSEKQAREFLKRNERRIRDRLCELGFEVIETLLREEDTNDRRNTSGAH